MTAKTVWISPNQKYWITKESDRAFSLFEGKYNDYTRNECEIWKECDNDDVFITGCLGWAYDVPKYVKKALEKHVGDILY